MDKLLLINLNHQFQYLYFKILFLVYFQIESIIIHSIDLFKYFFTANISEFYYLIEISSQISFIYIISLSPANNGTPRTI